MVEGFPSSLFELRRASWVLSSGFKEGIGIRCSAHGGEGRIEGKKVRG